MPYPVYFLDQWYHVSTTSKSKVAGSIPKLGQDGAKNWFDLQWEADDWLGGVGNKQIYEEGVMLPWYGVEPMLSPHYKYMQQPLALFNLLTVIPKHCFNATKRQNVGINFPVYENLPNIPMNIPMSMNTKNSYTNTHR
jgi:hypothetical protein